jgi:serine/threonine protein kinase
LNNRYQKVRRLGEGSYGTVYLAVDTKPQGGQRRADAAALKLLEKVPESNKFGEGAAGSGDAEMKEAAQEAI